MSSLASLIVTTWLLYEPVPPSWLIEVPPFEEAGGRTSVINAEIKKPIEVSSKNFGPPCKNSVTEAPDARRARILITILNMCTPFHAIELWSFRGH